MKMRAGLVAAAGMLVAACGGNHPHQLVAATVPDALTVRPYEVVGPTEGTSCQVKLLSVLALQRGGRLYDARKIALEAASAEALIDTTVDRSSHSFLVVSRDCTTIAGTAIRFEGGLR